MNISLIEYQAEPIGEDRWQVSTIRLGPLGEQSWQGEMTTAEVKDLAREAGDL